MWHQVMMLTIIKIHKKEVITADCYHFFFMNNFTLQLIEVSVFIKNDNFCTENNYSTHR